MSLESTAANTEPLQSETTETHEASQTISLSQPPDPLTFSTAPTWFATDTPMLSERPPEAVAPPKASPERAAKMKRIVLAAIGGCLVIVLVAGWRVWQHRRAKAMDQQAMAMVSAPSPAPTAETIAPPPAKGEGASAASPNAPSSNPASTSATAPSGAAPSLRQAPTRTVKSHAAPRKPSSAKRK